MNSSAERTRPARIRRILVSAVYFIVVFIVTFTVTRECHSTDNGEYTRTQLALGTIVEIKIRGVDAVAAENAITAAFAEIRRVDTLFSAFMPDSPLWKLNHGGDSIQTVPAELYALLRRCEAISHLTDGAFDASLEAIIQVWGFDGDTPAVPDNASLETARASSGWSKVELLDNNKIRLQDGTALNLGGIAKGYAVDRAVTVLTAHDVQEAMVNAGGEVRCVGEWSVGVQDPRVPEGIAVSVRLDTRSIATSGDYEHYFEENGVRYHHIIDPATGRPATGCRSVSVLAADNTTADALATAVFVMGTVKGMEFFSENKHIDGMIIDGQGVIHSTSGFDKSIMR